MRGIMFDERGEHPIEFRLRAGAAFRCQRPFDHAPGAASDQPPGGVVGNRRQAFARENEVERRDEIGRGIDQCTVEIENDREHDFAYPANAGGASVAGQDRGSFAPAKARRPQ